jgi:hypothetical protein
VKAAKEQITRRVRESEFIAWLEAKRAKKHFVEYDPDQAFAALEGRIKEGEEMPVVLEER